LLAFGIAITPVGVNTARIALVNDDDNTIIVQTLNARRGIKMGSSKNRVFLPSGCARVGRQHLQRFFHSNIEKQFCIK